VHLFQVSSNPIKVGVLSGYVSDPVREVRCESYMYSQFGTVSRWIEDLKKSEGEEMFSELFAPVEIHVADMGSGFYPIVIDPFGECFPEKGVGRGVALQTILEYIRDGGIFVNSAGHPFIYTWNVDAASDNQRMLVSSFSTITGVQVKRNQGGELQIEPTHKNRLRSIRFIRAVRLIKTLNMVPACEFSPVGPECHHPVGP
jgi:hypothetical protein